MWPAASSIRTSGYLSGTPRSVAAFGNACWNGSARANASAAPRPSVSSSSFNTRETCAAVSGWPTPSVSPATPSMRATSPEAPAFLAYPAASTGSRVQKPPRRFSAPRTPPRCSASRMTPPIAGTNGSTPSMFSRAPASLRAPRRGPPVPDSQGRQPALATSQPTRPRSSRWRHSYPSARIRRLVPARCPACAASGCRSEGRYCHRPAGTACRHVRQQGQAQPRTGSRRMRARSA